MQDTGFFADIQCDILQLIWPIIDTDTDICVYFLPTPNCRVTFTVSIIMHALTMLAHRQTQA